MSQKRELIALGLIALAAGLLLPVFLMGEMATKERNLLGRIPKEIGQWRGVDLPRPFITQFLLISDFSGVQTLVREYRNPEGQILWLMAVHDLEGTHRAVKNPQYSYENQGWYVLERGVESWANADGGLFRLNRLLYRKRAGPDARLDLYAYVMGERVVTSEMEVRTSQVWSLLTKRVLGRGREIIFLDLSGDVTMGDRASLETQGKQLFGTIAEILRAGAKEKPG